MNERQYRSLARYIHDAANRLGLKDWKLSLDGEPCPDQDHAATINVTYARKTAHIQVCGEFAHLGPIEQRHVIAHELAHVHMNATLDYLEENLPVMVGAVAWTPLSSTIRMLFEQGIDGVAIGMESALPFWSPPK